MLRFRVRHATIDIEEVKEFLQAPEHASESGILEALMTLSEKFKVVLYLYYVEEYSVEEIAHMIGRTPSAVKMRLKKGRQLLEEKYRKHDFHHYPCRYAVKDREFGGGCDFVGKNCSSKRADVEWSTAAG